MASTDNDRQKHIGQAEEKIREAAERIDPYTARIVWWYAKTLDPYGLGYEVPPEADCVGREYFLADPKGECAVLVSDVRARHPEIPDREWEELMRAAGERDDSLDPFPFFHRYRADNPIEGKTSPSSSRAPDDPKEDHLREAAALFERLVEAVAAQYDLDYDEALRFIRESCKAGGFPNSAEEPELVEELRKAARDEPDVGWLLEGPEERGA